VLLLVVLSILTLFMMLGVSYVAIATRAKRAARAFANNVATATAFGASEQDICDQAFFTVVRGSQDTLAQAIPLGTTGNENLLADKYGTGTITGRFTAASNFAGVTNGAFIQLTTSSLSPATANASDLAGRVVTLTAPGMSVSTRILRATGPATSPTLVIAGGPTPGGKPLSLTAITTALGLGAGTVVINGREFAGGTGAVNEPWDGIDPQNPLLARVRFQDSNSNGVQDAGEAIYFDMSPFALGSTGTLPLVDNDGDGFTDSRFVDINLPPIVTQKGTLYPKAAILVADLDGRLNVNAHGGPTDENSFDTANSQDMYPTATGVGAVPLYQLPRGGGIGPAEITLDRSLIFSSNPVSTQSRIANSTIGNSGLSDPSGGGKTSDTSTGRYVPMISNVEGRYADGASGVGGSINAGSSAKPGWGGMNDTLSVALDQWRAALNGSNVAQCFFTASSSSRYGTPADFKGQMRVWVDDTGRPVYYKPAWRSVSGASTTQPPNALYNDVVDDPYEVNLTRSASRTPGNRTPTSAAATTPDALYTPGELEGLLRFYDPDSPKLPSRLVALLRDSASSARHVITTESWDTPAVTGDAWQTVIGDPFATLLNATGLVSPNRAQDLFSPETLLGHRLDLNRPFHDVPNYAEPNDATGTQRRQAFAKQLYCLFVAIAATNGTSMPMTASIAEQLAQYAINIVDFRDADSVMTKFSYDPNFSPTSTTWTPGANNYVWGCERPEVIITETWAWHDRRTSDLASPGGKVNDPLKALNMCDPHYDQQRRPQGAFFVELYSPWGSSAREYVVASGTTQEVADPIPPVGTAPPPADTFRADPLPSELAATEDLNGNGLLDAGEDTNGNGQIDYIAAPERRLSTVGLERMAPASSPVWRLVTVRGDNAFGTDPVVPAATNPTRSILDPSRPLSTATIDRAFYFVQPSTAIQASTGANTVFWQQAPGGPNPSPTNYVVVGTDAPFNPLTSGTAPANTRVLKGPSGQPASITEPLCANDPYDAIMQAISPGNAFTAPNSGNSNVGFWASPADTPLDAATSFAGVAAITSAPFLDSSSNPRLMFNGTHDNFAVVHLQRLANPQVAWNASTNPYVTIDSMTVDLSVVNSDGAGNSFDEPGTTGATPLAYLLMQYPFGSSGSKPISTERGGKISQITGTPPPAHDIWSGVVKAASPLLSVDDADSFRTASSSPTRAASGPGAPFNPTYTISASGTTSPGDSHSLRFPPERFFDTAGSKPHPYAWMFWPNRPFVSAAELSYVPVSSPFSLLRRHTIGNGSPRAFFHLPAFFENATPLAPWDALAGRTATPNAASRTLWHFLHVPSPFAAVYRTVPTGGANAAALTTLGLDIFPINQLSHFREPGRINVNTIGDKRTWRGLLGEVAERDDLPGPPPAFAEALPRWSENLYVTTTPGGTSEASASWLDFMQTLPELGKSVKQSPKRNGGYVDSFVNEDKPPFNGTLDPSEDVNGNGQLDTNDYRNTDRHAYFRYQTMTRMMNNTTVRSHVFTIWVTIGYFDAPGAGGAEITPAVRNRGFYIFDRSIPVGYELGKNHNVTDAVLLRRIIQ
jgi:hypothetical protein